MREFSPGGPSSYATAESPLSDQAHPSEFPARPSLNGNSAPNPDTAMKLVRAHKRRATICSSCIRGSRETGDEIRPEAMGNGLDHPEPNASQANTQAGITPELAQQLTAHRRKLLKALADAAASAARYAAQ